MQKKAEKSSAVSRRDFLVKTGVSLAGITVSGTTLGMAGQYKGEKDNSLTSEKPGTHAPGKVFTMAVGTVRMTVIERLIKQGRMPVFEKLIREGAVTSELLNLCANKSHAALISAFTGATTGTHRAITILRAENGKPPLRQDLLGKICRTEYLWDTAERQGKKVIVLNFPDSWPSKIKKGILIAGASLNVNATLYEGPYERSMGFPVFRYAVAADEVFSTKPETGWSEMKFLPLKQSGAKPAGIKQGFAARLPLKCNTPDREILKKPVLWLIIDSKDNSVSIFNDGQWKAPLGTVAPGKWSTRLDMNVETGGGTIAVAFKMKLMELDIQKLAGKLYVSPLGPINDGRMIPDGGVPELATLKTFPLPGSVVMNRDAALLDPVSQRELLAMSGDWYIDALRVLIQKPFDLFVFQTNDLDWGEHSLTKHFRNGVSKEECIKIIDNLYEDLDQQVGKIIKLLPSETTFLLMSPHGCVNPWDIKGSKSANEILANAGLLIKTSSGEIDYDKSLAYPAPEGEGFVNVAPWQPKTPEEIAEREKNLQKACSALSSATDEKTGERIFTVVLPWDDAAPFGLSGPSQADIITFKPPAYGGIHGPCWPLTVKGESDIKGMCLLWGPGIHPGSRETHPVYPEDIAPTAAYLLGIDPPADSEGKVLYRMLD
jgi:predicted AlkP superfamily phosphohydrolase/phosphomutase